MTEVQVKTFLGEADFLVLFTNYIGEHREYKSDGSNELVYFTIPRELFLNDNETALLLVKKKCKMTVTVVATLIRNFGRDYMHHTSKKVRELREAENAGIAAEYLLQELLQGTHGSYIEDTRDKIDVISCHYGTIQVKASTANEGAKYSTVNWK